MDCQNLLENLLILSNFKYYTTAKLKPVIPSPRLVQLTFTCSAASRGGQRQWGERSKTKDRILVQVRKIPGDNGHSKDLPTALVSQPSS